MNSTYTLSSMVRKCQSCLWVGDSWDIYCSVDKSHKTEQMFAWFSSDEMNYKYSFSPSQCD